MGRRRNDNALSLFAFQDIITGVAGVMLFILLLLVVQLAIPAAQKIQEKQADAPLFPVAAREDVERLEELRAELAELRQKTEDLLQVQTMRPGATLDELKRKLDSLNQQQQTLVDEIRSLREKIQSPQSRAASEQIARSVEQLQRELGDVKAEIEQLADGDFISFQSAANMPDVWLIDVRNESAEFLRLQNPTEIERVEFDADISAARLATQLTRELKLKNAGTSVVVLLRPSAAGRGSELLMQMQAAGYRVALELLNSETQIMQSTEASR